MEQVNKELGNDEVEGHIKCKSSESKESAKPRPRSNSIPKSAFKPEASTDLAHAQKPEALIDHEEDDRRIDYKDLTQEISKNTLSKEELYAWFREELDKRDALIEKLKQENALLFKTAIKAREELITGSRPGSKNPPE